MFALVLGLSLFGCAAESGTAEIDTVDDAVSLEVAFVSEGVPYYFDRATGRVFVKATDEVGVAKASLTTGEQVLRPPPTPLRDESVPAPK